MFNVAPLTYDLLTRLLALFHHVLAYLPECDLASQKERDHGYEDVVEVGLY
jgi:hypothetical protein